MKMTKLSVMLAGLMMLGISGLSSTAEAIPVDLELILATDTSGSVDGADFALRRSGTEAAFRDPAVIAAIEAGLIGSIAVTLWDFGDGVGVAVDWMLITDATSANAFADAVAAAGRLDGGGDGQANMLRQAAIAINANNYEGIRNVVDIVSEGVQSGEGCNFDNPDCQATRDARDAFLAAGGTAVNAIWMRDRDFFGIHAGATVNALEYGALSVIGGTNAFQVFAETNDDFVNAIDDKIIREVRDTPEPSSLLMFGAGLAMAGAWIRRRR